MVKAKVEEILSCLERMTTHSFVKEEFRAKLSSGKPLRIKYEVDIRTPALHLGHAVNLWLLRRLQDAGHKAVIVFSDFTNRQGDLDGRLETIWNIPQKEADRHIRDITEQLKAVLRFDAPALIEIRRNSEWYSKMSVQDMLNIFSLATHAKLIARDEFQLRIAEGREIYLNEMIYPLLQGYDSYVVRADASILGSDRLFNESLGRLLQEKHKHKPQTLIVVRMAPGIDGKRKQSHKHDNHISLTHSPRDKFGRVMSIPDTMIGEFFHAYTDVPAERIPGILAKGPREAKAELACAIVAKYHGAAAAQAELDWFDNTVSKGYVPDKMPELPVPVRHIDALELVKLSRPKQSRADTRRLIEQGGVYFNGSKLQKPGQELKLHDNDTLRVGRRNWYRIRIAEPPSFETSRLALRPVQLGDIEELVRHVPKDDMDKYIVRFRNLKKKKDADVRDAVRKIVLEGGGRSEWLWMVSDRSDPQKVLGIAHLRGDSKKPQNIWLAPSLVDKPAVVREAMLTLSNHLLPKLSPKNDAFKDAFEDVNGLESMDQLYENFRNMNADLLAKDVVPVGAPGFTHDGWEHLQEWRRITSPWLFKLDPRNALKQALEQNPGPDGPKIS